MTSIGPILDYHPVEQPPPRQLTLEETSGCVRVTFAVNPKWVYILPIAQAVLIGCIKIAGALLIVRLLWQVTHGSGRPPSRDIQFLARHIAATILVSAGVAASLWWTSAGYYWWMYRRWGRVPRVLRADLEGLSYSRLGWWSMRERRWPANEITCVEFRTIKRNLNWRRTVADLYIRRRDRRRLRFRLSSSDPRLPGLIAQRLALTIGCPLT